MASASGHFNVARGGNRYASAVALVDTAYMGFYQQVRISARRISRVLFALLPLMMLLVGSCKTSQVTDSFSTGTETAQFRAALFPDRPVEQVQDAAYQPANGYVNRARDYIEGDPSALMRLTEAEVGYLFGKPTMERKDADARIWQYKTKSCVVDFFFYDDADAKGVKTARPVSYVDFRLKEDLQQGSAARLEPVPASSQSQCIEKIVSGDGFSFTG